MLILGFFLIILIKVKPMFPIIKQICEQMTKYVDEKNETGTNSFIAKDVSM